MYTLYTIRASKMYAYIEKNSMLKNIDTVLIYTKRKLGTHLHLQILYKIK